ncbi:MAG: AAA family ATPase [Candidatus Thorarchaeota archaeon]|nr:AAA family ATPase [Candidatus Thorarchaeota archaeon]
MKIAVTGKGGVGKTTITGTLARLLGRDGFRILAIDADPNYNLWSAIGIDEDVASGIEPLLENEELVRAKTDMKWVEVLGNFFQVRPSVDDLTALHAVEGPDNVSLLVAGTVNMGGQGCMCPSAALLKALIGHLSLESDEAFIMDMDAGIENLGRGTTKGMDILLAVVEPGRRSLDTIDRIRGLAADIGLNRVFAIGNKVMNTEDEHFIESILESHNIPLLGIIPYDENIRTADRLATAPIDLDENTPAIQKIRGLKNTILQKLKELDSDERHSEL